MRYRAMSDGYLVRLERGEEILDGLRSLMLEEGIGSGAVTGLGAVTDVRLGCFLPAERRYEERTFDETYELCSLVGSLSWHDGEPFPHVHVVLADPDFRALGGHCFEARVTATVELRVRAAEARVERRMDDLVGLHLMELPDDCPVASDR